MKGIAIGIAVGLGVAGILVGAVFVYYAWQYWRQS